MSAEESRFRPETAAELRLARDRLARASRMARLGAWEFDVLSQEMIWSDMLYAAMEGALQRGEAYEIEVRMTTGKGREIWVRTMGQPEM